MASRWWIFIACACICSGFLLPVGIVIMVWYIIDLIMSKDTPLINTGKQYIDNHYTQNIDKYNYFDQKQTEEENKKEEKQTFNKGANKNKPMDFMDYKTRDENK